MPRTLDEIIDLLGGETALARQFNCGLSAISNWKARGIPPARQIQLSRLAAQLRIRPPVTLDELEALSTEARGARQAEPCV